MILCYKMTHEGPQYDVIDPSIKPDNFFYTEIQLLGDAPSKGFSWLDGYEKLVNVSSVEPEIKVIFPVCDGIVMFRANNIDSPGMHVVRIACRSHDKWCEATLRTRNKRCGKVNK